VRHVDDVAITSFEEFYEVFLRIDTLAGPHTVDLVRSGQAITLAIYSIE
jgi:hypothetical protein